MRWLIFTSFILFGLSSCCRWVVVEKQIPRQSEMIELPYDDARFIYYKVIGHSRNNAGMARKSAEDALFQQIARSIYQELNENGIHLDNDRIGEITRCVIAVCGVTIEQDAERLTTERYREECPCRKDKYSDVTLYEITLLAKYPRADFMRAMKDALNGC